jgi:gamma-glutamylcyclotransferase (GGCT)/AIG2-like uncharacterized protein YtfP
MRDRQDLLFVYGTLMRDVNHPMARLLSLDTEFCGAARCRGRLYLVMQYPGLVLSDDAGDVVFGEVVRLHRPQHTFETLDKYEGCGPGVASPLYLRQLLRVTLDDGTVREAWTYVYNRPVDKLKRIVSGRFLKQ